METLAIAGSTDLTQNNWQSIIDPSKSHFTADDMIDAYFIGKDKGWESGMSDRRNEIKRIFESNLKKTVINRNEVLKYLTDNGFTPQYTYLKINSWNNFELLITVSEDDFVDEKFLKVYSLVSTLEQKIVQIEAFELSFSFTDFCEGFDDKQLKADGYSAKFKLQNIN